MTQVGKIPLSSEHIEGIMLSLSSGEDQFLMIDPHLISPDTLWSLTLSVADTCLINYRLLRYALLQSHPYYKAQV